jgi:hypothetical protein
VDTTKCEAAAARTPTLAVPEMPAAGSVAVTSQVPAVYNVAPAAKVCRPWSPGWKV